MSSQSYSSESDCEDSELQSSDSDDFDMEKSQPRKPSNKQSSSSSTISKPKKKKQRLESTNKQLEGSKEWRKPELTNVNLGTLALMNLTHHNGSGKEIREFLIEQFPHLKSFDSKKWRSMNKVMQITVGILTTRSGTTHNLIFALVKSKCAKIKGQLEKKLTENAESIKLTMSNPDNFDMFLKNVRDYACVEADDETSEPKPKVSVVQLILDVFKEAMEAELTVKEILTNIVEKYPYYGQSTEQLKLHKHIASQLRFRILFDKCGQKGQENVWKLNFLFSGLALPSRIPHVPPPIKTMIEKSEEIFLIGNPSGHIANFYYEGDDPTEMKNYKSLKNICVTTNGPPGRYKSYISWMTCIDPSTCPFGENCFKFIFGNSDQEFCSITQSGIAIAVTDEYKKRKVLLPVIPNMPPQSIDTIDDDEESGFLDDCDGEEDESDPSDNDEEPLEKMDDNKKDEGDDKKNKKPGPSCKGPLDFLLQLPNHEFRKENCLALWTTNNRKLKRTLKNFPRGAYKDISKAKGMYPQMDLEAYAVFDSLKIALPFRKKYIIRAQKEGRLQELPTPKLSSFLKNNNLDITAEDLDNLINERQVVITAQNGQNITINIK